MQDGLLEEGLLKRKSHSSSHKYLQISYYVPDTVLGASSTISEQNKQGP